MKVKAMMTTKMIGEAKARWKEKAKTTGKERRRGTSCVGVLLGSRLKVEGDGLSNMKLLVYITGSIGVKSSFFPLNLKLEPKNQIVVGS